VGICICGLGRVGRIDRDRPRISHPSAVPPPRRPRRRRPPLPPSAAVVPPLLRRPQIEVLLLHLSSPSPPHHPCSRTPNPTNLTILSNGVSKPIGIHQPPTQHATDPVLRIKPASTGERSKGARCGAPGPVPARRSRGKKDRTGSGPSQCGCLRATGTLPRSLR
jgi:hypothetical protein